MIVMLDGKDAAIMGLFSRYHEAEEKLASLSALHEMLETVLTTVIFEGKEGDAEHTVKLDEHHSVIFKMKDGKFDYETTCTCEDHKDKSDEDSRITGFKSMEVSGGMAAAIMSSMLKG